MLRWGGVARLGAGHVLVLAGGVVGSTGATGDLGLDGLAEDVGHSPLGDAESNLGGVDVVVAEVSRVKEESRYLRLLW